MQSSPLLDVLRREVDAIRDEYVEAGRGEEFDAYVERLRANSRWPFDNVRRRRPG